MAQPFVADKGVIRLSPLQKVVASREEAAAGNNPSVGRSTGDVNTSTNVKTLPDGVSEEQVAEAQARAEAGDQDAIDWLKTLGLVGGGAAAAYAIHRVLKGRKAGIKGIGADNIAVEAAPPNATSAVAKRTKPVDLYVDRKVPEAEVRAGYIAPPVKKLPQYTPRIDGAAAMKAIRRLP